MVFSLADGTGRVFLTQMADPQGNALTLTYDFVLLDTGDEMIETVGPACGVAMVVSEFSAADPRTVSAFDRITDVADASILLLVVDPSPGRHGDTAHEDSAVGEVA